MSFKAPEECFRFSAGCWRQGGGLSHSDFVIFTASPEFSPGPSNFGIFAAEGLEDPITFNL